MRAAAVVGREFDAALVTELVDLDADGVVDALDEGLEANLLDDVGDRLGSVAFAHGLVRTTLLEELSTNRRIRLHARIGDVLESRPDPNPAELAYHYGEAAVAGEADKAIEYASIAATDALTHSAPAEACAPPASGARDLRARRSHRSPRPGRRCSTTWPTSST